MPPKTAQTYFKLQFWNSDTISGMNFLFYPQFGKTILRKYG